MTIYLVDLYIAIMIKFAKTIIMLKPEGGQNPSSILPNIFEITIKMCINKLHR